MSYLVAAGGIKAFGNLIRIHDVRVINFGTKTTAHRGVAITTAGAYPENPEPFDCVISDCVIEQPYPNSVRETVCIELAGGESPSDGVMGYHRGCVVRNCLINCMYSDNERPVLDLTWSSPNASVTTKFAHGRNVDHWIVVTGALIDSDPAKAAFNGSWKVTSFDNEEPPEFKYQPAAYGSVPAPSVAPAGEIYIGRAPSHRVGIQSLTLISGSKWELISRSIHCRVPSNNVVLNNVITNGLPNSSLNQASPLVDTSTAFTPIKLRFDCSASGPVDVSNAWIGVDFYGIVVNGGRSVVVENNHILNTTFGVYHGQWSTKDVTIRDNYFHNVLSAVFFQPMQQPLYDGVSLTRSGQVATFTTPANHGLSAGQLVVISNAHISGVPSSLFNGTFVIESATTTTFTYRMSGTPSANADSSPKPQFGLAQQTFRNGQELKYEGTGNLTAKFKTQEPHGLSVGQAVIIAGAKISGYPSASYNGIFVIDSVPDPIYFTYKMTSAPGAVADGAPNWPKFGALWQAGRLIIENNIMELILPIPGTPDPPVAIRLERKATIPGAPLDPYVFQQVFIRGNVIRHADNASDPNPSPPSLAVQLQSCAAAIIEDNVIRLDRATPIEFSACGTVKCFNNQSAAGKLIQGYKMDAGATRFINELETDVDLGTVSIL